MPTPIAPLTPQSSGIQNHTEEYPMSSSQINLLETMISDILSIKPQAQSVIRNEMMKALGLRSDEQLLARHFPDAVKYLTNQLYINLGAMDINHVIAMITKLAGAGSNRVIITNFIVKFFGVHELWQLRLDLLKAILQIIIDNKWTDNLESQLTGLNILKYLVQETANATGEHCSLIWEQITSLSGGKEFKDIPMGTIDMLITWLSAKRKLSTETDLRLENIQKVLQNSFEPEELLTLREYAQHHFQLSATMVLTSEQAQRLLDELMRKCMSAVTTPDMRNILPLYNQLSLNFTQTSKLLSTRLGLMLLAIFIVLLLIVIFV